MGLRKWRKCIVASCKFCSENCPKESGKRSSKFFCSPKCYLLFRTKKQEENCWLCKTAVRKDGYSSLKIDGKEVLAHRLSYQIFKGLIPSDKLVCHKCDVRNCVNPDHLYLGNDSTNALDRQRRNKSTCQTGEKNHRSFLTNQHILDIRKMCEKGFSSEYLCKVFNLKYSHFTRIKNRQIWAHI